MYINTNFTNKLTMPERLLSNDALGGSTVVGAVMINIWNSLSSKLAVIEVSQWFTVSISILSLVYLVYKVKEMKFKSKLAEYEWNHIEEKEKNLNK